MLHDWSVRLMDKYCNLDWSTFSIVSYARWIIPMVIVVKKC